MAALAVTAAVSAVQIGQLFAGLAPGVQCSAAEQSGDAGMQ
jgi:hypothetical protein